MVTKLAELSIWWILTIAVIQAKPIGECKTYFSIIGLEGSAINGTDICSRKEIPFVYFVLKCKDNDSVKCAKNLQWSALSVCDKVNIHHEEIPITRKFDSVEKDSELSMELSLYIQFEDEVNEVDDFSIETLIDPSDDNTKTYVNTVGKQHNTKLEVEFHRVCNLPEDLKNPFQVISYLLSNHHILRRKREVGLEYPDPSSVPVGYVAKEDLPSVQDDEILDVAGKDLFNPNIQGREFTPAASTTTAEPHVKSFWDNVADKQKGASLDTTGVSPSPTAIAPSADPNVTEVVDDNLDQKITMETTMNDIPTPESSTYGAITKSPYTPPKGRRTTSAVSVASSTVTTPNKTPGKSSAIPINNAEYTPSASASMEADTTEEQTTPFVKSTTTKPTTTVSATTTTKSTTTTTKTPTRPSTTPKPPPTSFTQPSTTPKPSPTTPKPPPTTDKIKSTTQQSPKTHSLKPSTNSISVDSESNTTQTGRSTTSNLVTEPNLNTPLTSMESGTAASSSDLGMAPTSEENNDSFWPIVAALVIGIPSVIVFGIAITVIHKKRLGRPPRFMSSSMYPSL
ncbi:hypothetical protein SNE40_012175 [Patella caerulea]|uniref:Uncharacterized protein n=1 Tax=Patella caerulea TaxID=87958 RepID=A0AAN8JR03_PATCE